MSSNVIWNEEESTFITIPDGDKATPKQIKEYYDNLTKIKVSDMQAVETRKIDDRPTLERLNIFNEKLDKMLELYQNKNHDYGDSVVKTFDEYGLMSFLVRMDDKMNRLKTLNKTDDIRVKGERIEDTLLDLANYAVLALTEIEYRKRQLLKEEE